MSGQVVIVGYSGHAFVVVDALQSSGSNIIGYCEEELKNNNPYNIKFLGAEDKIDFKSQREFSNCIVAIGDNNVREKVQTKIEKRGAQLVNAIHSTSIISKTVVFGKGNLISAGAIINSMTKIGNGVICNSRSLIEHECILGDYVHVGPGTVLCGNVHVGNNTLIGAGSVVLPNIIIGKNAIIGAGSVVVKNVPDNVIIKGNPAR